MPVILFVDIIGKVGTAAPAQTVTLVPKLKTGVMLGLTVTVKLAVVAHCPVVGVKV